MCHSFQPCMVWECVWSGSEANVVNGNRTFLAASSASEASVQRLGDRWHYRAQVDSLRVQPRKDADDCTTYNVSPGETYTFTSEDYPEKYPNNEKCIRKFIANAEATFTVECPVFKLKSSAGCVDDFLRIKFEGGDKSRFCGNAFITQTGTTDELTIKFQTDKKKRDTGFSCRVIVTNPGEAPKCTCGVPNTELRIVGGAPTRKHDYPWQVALVPIEALVPVCGGTIISHQWILTAAHCVFDVSPDVLKVVIGEHNWLNDQETTVTERRTVVEIIWHEDYDPDTFDNDVALMRLKEPIVFPSDNKIAPVCLPVDDDDDYTGVDATVTGWGSIVEDGPQTTKLYEVTVPVISNLECETKYSADAITDQMLCAGLDEGGKDSCQGDSGGPLFTPGDGSQSHMIQIGVVSWGEGCAQPNFPGVYARLSKFLNWIDEKTNDATPCTPPTSA
ncbi:trypsin-1-like isoform X2 [Panulirus ornatus]|uniref:trypsin-1-like isoform X2 n=1 Tax=Panulirus ornatus TaxID=150431 RepID=UPI003A83A2E5